MSGLSIGLEAIRPKVVQYKMPPGWSMVQGTELFHEINRGITSINNLVIVRDSLQRYGKTAQLKDFVGTSFEGTGVTFSIEGITDSIKKFFKWVKEKIVALWKWFRGLISFHKNKSNQIKKQQQEINSAATKNKDIKVASYTAYKHEDIVQLGRTVVGGNRKHPQYGLDPIPTNNVLSIAEYIIKQNENYIEMLENDEQAIEKTFTKTETYTDVDIVTIIKQFNRAVEIRETLVRNLNICERNIKKFEEMVKAAETAINSDTKTDNADRRDLMKALKKVVNIPEIEYRVAQKALKIVEFNINSMHKAVPELG